MAVVEIAALAACPPDLSSIALRRLSASYFSGEFSDKLTEGLELVFGVMGVVGEYMELDLGLPMPESTE